MGMVEVAGGRVQIEIEGPVAVFEVCRPEVHNALDLECLEALGRFVEMIGQRADVCAVILAGRGASFISGGDLRQFSTLRGVEAGNALSRRGGYILAALEDLPQLTIAAMGGDTYGGGVELALACDLRFIERSSNVALVQGRHGLTTAWGGGVRLARCVGYARALEIMLEGRQIPAEEARALGMVNRVVDDGQALVEARAMAARAAALTTPVVEGAKRVLRAAVTLEREEAWAEERRVFSELWGSAHHEARVQDFMDRRTGGA